MRLLVILAAVVAALPSVGSEHFEVGAASVSISPEDGAYLAGYGRDRTSLGVADELYAKAVVVRSRATDAQLVLLTLDNIGLTRPDVLLVRAAIAQRLAMPASHVIVSSTHTHAGPDVVGLWGPSLWRSGRNPGYMSWLQDQAVAAAAQAYAKAQPARLIAASAAVRLPWVENRSEPDLIDPMMTTLQFVAEDGRAVVTLTSFACHPTVLDDQNRYVSADYVGGYYAAMAQQIEGEHLFLQGAIGGWVQPLASVGGFDVAQRFGAELALASRTLLQDHGELIDEAGVVLNSAEFDIPLANWGFRLAMLLQVLPRDTVDGALRTEAAWFRIGSVEFVTHPGETSPAYSFASRRLMKAKHTIVMGLTQDALGYILKPDYFADDAPYPHAAYLRSVSVGEQAGPLLMETLTSLVP